MKLYQPVNLILRAILAYSHVKILPVMHVP
jgi:hypothetical protein